MWYDKITNKCNGGESKLDFIRIACAVPAVKVGDVKKNVQEI